MLRFVLGFRVISSTAELSIDAWCSGADRQATERDSSRRLGVFEGRTIAHGLTVRVPFVMARRYMYFRNLDEIGRRAKLVGWTWCPTAFLALPWRSKIFERVSASKVRTFRVVTSDSGPTHSQAMGGMGDPALVGEKPCRCLRGSP